MVKETSSDSSVLRKFTPGAIIVEKQGENNIRNYYRKLKKP